MITVEEGGSWFAHYCGNRTWTRGVCSPITQNTTRQWTAVSCR